MSIDPRRALRGLFRPGAAAATAAGLLLLLTASACGGSAKSLSSPPADPAPATQAPPVAPVETALPAAEPPGPTALPDPAALALPLSEAAARSASSFSSRWIYPTYYATNLPYANIAEEDIVRLGFSPQFDPKAEAPQVNPAYATFYFSGMDQFTGPNQLILEWTVPPAADCLWLALANFERGSWEWFPLDSGPLSTLNLAGFEPYMHPESKAVFFCVLLTGTQPASLEYLVAGQPAEAELFIGSNLSGNPPNGDAPLQVYFQLYPNTPGSLVTGYDIDWEGDGVYDSLDSQGETPSKLFVPGTYSTTFRMHTSDGQSVTASYDLVAKNPGNNPPVAVLAAIPDGEGFYAVTLDASASTDGVEIIAYEWDVDSDSAVDIITTIPFLPYVFCRSGTQTVSVTVRDNDLATDTASQTFTLGGALGKTTLAYDLTFAPQFSLALSTVSGPAQRAGVAWFDAQAGVLYYRQALTDNGESWGGLYQPAGGTLDDGWGVSLAATVVPGQQWPMLAYGSGAGQQERVTRFRHATNETGSSWSDEVTVCDLPDTGSVNRLLNVNGKPALVTGYQYGFSGAWELYYIAASDTAGNSWGTERQITENPGGMLNDFQVLPNGSHLLLGFLQDFGNDVFGNEIEFAFADFDPVAQSYSELYRGDLPHAYDLALGRLADSRFAILAGRSNQVSQGWWASSGALGTDWSAPAELGPTGYGGSGAFVIYDGKPLLVYHNWDQRLTLRLANDAAGTSWSLPALIDPEARYTALPQAVIVNGEPLIVYYDANEQLVALYKEPWPE